MILRYTSDRNGVTSVSDESRMHRMQFYIEPKLRDALASLAERRGDSMAELIREAIQALIHREAMQCEGDPALDLIGMIDWPDVPADAASNHDRYIYLRDWER